MKKSAIVLSIIATLFVVPLVSADADFAIYTGPGSWEPSIASFKAFLEWKGLTWEEVNHRDINRGELIGHFDGLFMPGGWAGTYNQRIRASGDQHIRDFVSGGGAYVGMSAGAFYACDVTIWEGDYLDYPSDMFNGECIGPIPEIAPWPDYTMTTMDINLNLEANQYEPAQRDVLYYGEPYFVPYGGQTVETFATWIVPGNPVADGAPGIIGVEYGAGRLLLVGPHPEIEEDDSRDNNNFGEELSDGPDGSDWPFLWTALDWTMNNPISMPPGYEPPAPASCDDGVDNDGDGLVDLADPGCENSADDDEYNVPPPVPECADGVDNDSDGLVDLADPDCDDANDNSESSAPVVYACSDGLDNDGDGLVDAADPGCDDAFDNDEFNEVVGPTDLFFDDFEVGLSAWTLTQPGGGDPWLASTTDPAFGGASAYCKPRDTTDPASVLTTTVDTTGYSGITLEYYRKVNGLDAADDFIASWTDGSGWYELEHISSHTDSSYVLRSYALPASADNNPNVGIRFSCTAGAVSEWCSVDNVRVIGM